MRSRGAALEVQEDILQVAADTIRGKSSPRMVVVHREHCHTLSSSRAPQLKFTIDGGVAKFGARADAVSERSTGGCLIRVRAVEPDRPSGYGTARVDDSSRCDRMHVFHRPCKPDELFPPTKDFCTQNNQS